MGNVIMGAGEVKPVPVPQIVHDDQYNVDVHLAPYAGKVEMDILVPTHANIHLTIQCINSIIKFTQTPYHLIVLDDAPVNDYGLTEKYIRELQKERVNITYCHSNIHWKTGNTFFNVGIRYSRSDYIVTCMNSMTVEPAWEIAGLSLMKQDPLIGTIGFKCLFPNGLVESAGIAFQGVIPTDMGRDEPGYRCNEIREAQAVQWAFAMHRKKALEGNLEEDAFNGHVGWDDIDNNLVVKSKGWKIFYCGQGVGIHAPRATRGSNTLEAMKLNHENCMIFMKRWGFWEKYLEGNKMNVADVMKHETKDALTMSITKIQVLQGYIKQAEVETQNLVTRALKELGVDPNVYVLEMNPQTNTWALKTKTEVKTESVTEVKEAPKEEVATVA